MNPLRAPHAAISTVALLAAATLLYLTPAAAQPAWKPDRPVTLVVPYSPGGGVDTMVRHLGRELQQKWGQNVLVENLPGADGLIGTRKVVDAKADGHTLLVQIPALTLSRHLPGFKGTDPVAQLTPISVYAVQAGVLATHTSVPGNTLGELVQHCKAAAPPCSFGTTENTAKLQLQMLAQDMPSMVVVNYKGGGQLITDLVGGSLNAGLFGFTAALPYQKSGRIKILATVGKKRSPVLPNVQTVEEAGFPQLQSETWYGLFAPRATPAAVVDALAAAVREAAREPAFVNSIAVLGATPVGNTSAEFAALVRESAERYADLVRRFPLQ